MDEPRAYHESSTLIFKIAYALEHSHMYSILTVVKLGPWDLKKVAFANLMTCVLRCVTLLPFLRKIIISRSWLHSSYNIIFKNVHI